MAQPLIDVGPAFKAAANAALGKDLRPPFNPYNVRNAACPLRSSTLEHDLHL